MSTLFEMLPPSRTIPGYVYCESMPLLSLELDAAHRALVLRHNGLSEGSTAKSHEIPGASGSPGADMATIVNHSCWQCILADTSANANNDTCIEQCLSTPMQTYHLTSSRSRP